MIEFKGVNMVVHKNNGIGFCKTEIDDNMTMKTYFYINRDSQEIYYLHNPMCKVFQIDGIDDV